MKKTLLALTVICSAHSAFALDTCRVTKDPELAATANIHCSNTYDEPSFKMSLSDSVSYLMESPRGYHIDSQNSEGTQVDLYKPITMPENSQPAARSGDECVTPNSNRNDH